MDSGERIGHLVIEEELGRGAFGRVYRARDTRIKRRVALKVVFAADTHEREQARVLREAHAAGQLHHPNIVTLFHVHDGGAGQWMFEMEYLEGGTLAELLATGEPVAAERAADLAIDVAEGLRAAHAAGVVHGDVKPGNALLDASGAAKVADFGLARLAADESLSRGELDAAGTPAYMAPEIVMGESPSPATDIWSYGVLLYQLIAGRLPFAANNLAALFYAIQNDEPDAPEHGLAAIALHCLRKDPRDRPHSFDEIVLALRRPAEPETEARRADDIALLGRDGETERAASLLGTGAALLVTGDAGAGKSALTRAVRTIARRRGIVWIEAAVTPVRGLLRPLLEAARDAIDARRRPRSDTLESVSTEVRKLLDSTPSLKLEERGKTLWAFESLLRELATEGSVALAIEDGHHADAEDLRALEHLAVRLPADGVFLLVTARGGHAHRLAARPRVERIELENLSRSDTYRHIRSLTGARHVEPEVAARIWSATEGNPLFTEELCRHLVRTEAVTKDGDVLRPGPDWSETTFPRRLNELCAQRLGVLSEDERSLLDVAAVDGVEIDGEVVGAVTGEPTVAVLRRLQRLYRTHGFVVPAPAGFRFASGLFQEAVYRDLAPELRRLLHKTIAEHLEQREEPADPERVGVHWERAGDIERATPYLRRAAGNASNRQELTRAIDLARRGGITPENLDQETAREEARLCVTLANCYQGTGDLEKGEALVDAVISSTKCDRMRARAIVQRAILRIYGHGPDEDVETQLRDVLVVPDLPLEMGRALYLLGIIAKYRGDLDQAEQRFSECEAQCREHDLRQLLSSSLDQLGSVALRRSDYEEAERHYEKAAELAEQTGRRTNAAVSRINGAIARVDFGQLTGVAKTLTACIAELELEGARIQAGHGALHLARVRYALGDVDRATRTIADAVAELRRAKYLVGLAPALATQAHLMALSGDLAEAIILLDEALAIAQKAEHREQEVDLNALMALVHTWDGEFDRAKILAAQVVNLVTPGGPASDAAAKLALCTLYGASDELREWARGLLPTRDTEVSEVVARALVNADPGPLREDVGDGRAELRIVADYLEAHAGRQAATSKWRTIAERGRSGARELGHVWLEAAFERLL